jgi:histidinol-phosphate/aromatic aminotransferase/cobyric acid decarboxylase-like protein
MRGSIPPPRWPARAPKHAVLLELQTELADGLGVEPRRVLLAHGASEANAWILGYVARRRPGRGGAPVLRVRFPEYPPLYDGARAQGYRVHREGVPADLAAVSRPRNPGGDVWSEEAVLRFAAGARHLLVDETFREFAGVRSMAAAGRRGLWASGSFTKFFGADEIRVGFAVAPPEEVRGFTDYVGLVSDEVAPASAAAALDLLRRLRSIRRQVAAIVDRNRRALVAAVPGIAAPVGPMFFDRLGRRSGDALARRCAAASVLVCPGSFFGEPRGVRICLTRRRFPEALRAYLRVRGLRGEA